MIRFRGASGAEKARVQVAWELSREDIARLIIVAIEPHAQEDLNERYTKEFLESAVRGQLSLNASQSWRWEEAYPPYYSHGTDEVTAEEAWAWGLRQARRL